MEEYKVIFGQNLFDIALQLTGSVEGIYDLLICNPDINVDTDLKKDRVLYYHSDFIINDSLVKHFKEKGIVIKNGNFFYEAVDTKNLPRCCMVIKHKGDFSSLVGTIQGEIIIDWGDASKLSRATGDIDFVHGYTDNGQHLIKVYGEFTINNLDMSEIHGHVYPVEKIKYVEITAPKDFAIEMELLEKIKHE